MTTPQVKFCGMTRAEDIQAAEDLGAAYLGFIFVEASPRAVSLPHAQELSGVVRRARTVGVFSNQPDTVIAEYAQMLGLDYVQLHGDPDVERVRRMPVPVIQAFRGVPTADRLRLFLRECPYVLIDKADGEDEADFAAMADLPEDIRAHLFVAGGLTPENVGDCVTRIHPFAVDCARGIESAPGRKDAQLMTAFLKAIL